MKTLSNNQVRSFGDFLVTESSSKHNPHRLVFAFGRFQPPTIGHALVVNKVISTAALDNSMSAVFVSNTHDNSKNPLTAIERSKYIEKMFEHQLTGVMPAPKDAETGGIIGIMKELNRAGIFGTKVTDVTVVAGSDRVSEFKKKLDQYNGKLYSFKSINVISAGERDPDDESVAGMTGTKMRAAAYGMDYPKFRAGIPHSLSDKETKEMMLKIRKALSVRESFDIPLADKFLAEGVNDKAIFKAVFLIGGSGSGKDFILDKVLNGHGFTEMNSDKALEYLMKKNELDMKMPASENEARAAVREKAKSLSHMKHQLALIGRNGLIINGTGDPPSKYRDMKKTLESMGYETKAIFVSVTDDISKARNIERGELGGRAVPEHIRKQKFQEVHKNLDAYRKMFGDENFIEFDNSADLRRAAEDVRQAKAQELLGIFKVMRKFAEKKPEHPKATEWIEGESKRRGEPINFHSSIPTSPLLPAQPPKKKGEKAKPPKPAEIQAALDGHTGGAEDRDSPAAKRARKIGLKYHGYGRYGKDKPTHVSIGGGQGLGFLTKNEQINYLFEEEVLLVEKKRKKKDKTGKLRTFAAYIPVITLKKKKKKTNEN